ncbi:MAG: hypothetical protein J2P30_25800 [Actinobacteria bacterium]|nr:hypothetical protein [Actinomycetota bacterium]
MTRPHCGNIERTARRPADRGASGFQTLIERWNGSSWVRQPSPNLGTSDALDGVAATSSANIWAVGDYATGAGPQTLALHCC